MKNALLLLPLLAAASTAGAVDGFAQLQGFRTGLTGTIAGENSKVGPFETDLDRDVGFDRKVVVEGRAGLLLGRSRLSLAGAIFDHDQSRSVSGFSYGGEIFSAQAQVTSHLRWLEAEYGFALLADRMARVEVFLGLRLYRYEGEARGQLTAGPLGPPLSGSATAEATGPVPHVGALAELRPISLLVLRGSLKGFKGGVKQSHGHELDLEATAGVRIGPLFEAGAGWRRFDVEVSTDGGTDFDFHYRGLVGYLRVSR